MSQTMGQPMFFPLMMRLFRTTHEWSPRSLLTQRVLTHPTRLTPTKRQGIRTIWPLNVPRIPIAEKQKERAQNSACPQKTRTRPRPRPEPKGKTLKPIKVQNQIRKTSRSHSQVLPGTISNALTNFMVLPILLCATLAMDAIMILKCYKRHMVCITHLGTPLYVSFNTISFSVGPPLPLPFVYFSQITVLISLGTGKCPKGSWSWCCAHVIIVGQSISRPWKDKAPSDLTWVYSGPFRYQGKAGKNNLVSGRWIFSWLD